MDLPAAAKPLDYLAIGHVTQDTTPSGPTLGGTVAYAALTARAMGLRAGILTAASDDLDLASLQPLTIVRLPSPASTTFENRYTSDGRAQWLHRRAAPIATSAVPSGWRTAILHLAPVAAEVEARIAAQFPGAFLGVTPQGWFREWEPDGRVHRRPSVEPLAALGQASAVAFSLEDVGGDERLIAEIVEAFPVVAVTEGSRGCRLYWNGDVRRFAAPNVAEVDPTGAGDVFAAAFFVRLHRTRNPWEAARFAVELATRSVTREGLQGVPTPAEVQAATVEIR